MILTALMASGYHARLARAAETRPGIDAAVFSANALADPRIREEALERLRISDAVLLEPGEDPFWAQIAQAAGRLSVPVLRPRPDEPGAAAAAARVLIEQGGDENALKLWELLENLAKCLPAISSPEMLPANGLFHPRAPGILFESLEDFQARLDPSGRGIAISAAVITHRHYLTVDEPLVESALIEALEARGIPCVGIFIDQGAPESPIRFLERILIGPDGRSRVRLIVKMASLLSLGPGESESPGPFEDSPSWPAARLYLLLGVPVIQPVVSRRHSPESWAADPAGLGSDVGWTMTLPEFEGVIEPIIVGGALSGEAAANGSARVPIPERVGRLADRAKRLVELAETPAGERKLAIVIHNAPCASVEATVGAASRLDVFESIRELSCHLAARGWAVEPPESGKELLRRIMDHKAVSEFRWTTAAEIVAKGGALAQVPLEDYLAWHEDFPRSVKEALAAAWGEPPGREMDGRPPAMIHEGRIVVTGVRLGPNVVVMVQPKRGCAGGRCDGRVCEILRDPLIPPPHQFLATYRWIADRGRGFGAHVVLHAGTHGCLEFLPGKSQGLSRECLPDLAIGDLPNVYLYDSTATADALVAKRRGYAALVGHLPPPMIRAGLAGELAELDRLARAWEDAGPGSTSAGKILEDLGPRLAKSPLAKGLPKLDEDPAAAVRGLKAALRLAASSLVEDGLHVLGRNPSGTDLAAMVKGIVRHNGSKAPSPETLAAGRLGLDIGALDASPDEPVELAGGGSMSAAEALEYVLAQAGAVVETVLAGVPMARAMADSETLLGPLAERPHLAAPPPMADLLALEGRIRALGERISSSDELGALTGALSGGFTPPGPSGSLTLGHDQVAPGGRNLFARDPRRVPTPEGFETGRRLAEEVVARHVAETGQPPSGVAFFWTSADLVEADGEVLAQMLALMGLKPVWDPAGLVSGVEVVDLGALGRPRIDVTCRMSCVIRDMFRESYEFLDRAVSLCAGLDEPAELNLVRARALELLANDPPDREPASAWRRATARIFSQAPGSFEGGVYLAVMASAWETRADLAEILVHHDGHAYGEGLFGLEAGDLLEAGLKNIDVNLLTLIDDARDFLDGGCFFGAQGGLSAAAAVLKGEAPRAYCADGRDRSRPSVRTLSEELTRSLAARPLNPAWLETMAARGHPGAAEISRSVLSVYGWAATTSEVGDQDFDALTRAILGEESVREALLEHNPWALEEMGRRLLEAKSRGLWSPDPECLAILERAYLQAEGALEETLEAHGGEAQGGAVDVLTTRDLSKWRNTIDEARARVGLGPIRGPEGAPS